jgi:hypothetical protein
MKPRASSLLGVLVAAGAVLLVPLAMYATAYFTCTANWGTPYTGGKCRVYRSAWLAIAFIPASLVESAATGSEISTAWTDHQ